MASSQGFHEAPEGLSPATRDRHRAIVSLSEELEAVDWYDQRVDSAGDPELKGILAHNRDEEKEHAAMTLEWLRRHDPVWDEVLHTYLFAELPVLEAEADATGGSSEAPSAAAAGGDLAIRSLRGGSNL